MNINLIEKKKFKKFIVVFFVTLIAFLAIDGLENASDSLFFFKTNDALKGAVYLSWFILASFIFCLWLMAKNAIWNKVAIAVLTVSSFFEFSSRLITGDGLSYNMILQVAQNFGFQIDNEVLDLYGLNIFLALTGAFVLALAYILIQRYFCQPFIKSIWVYFLPALMYGSGYFILTKTNSYRSDFPIPYKFIDLLTYAKINNVYQGERTPVKIKPTVTPIFDHVVLIVDESIRGDFLSINGYPKETTPFLSKQKDRIENLGVAASCAVCSNYSNAILVSGARIDQLPASAKSITNNPNIFQFARAAGYQSNLLYSVGYENKPSGLWTKGDLQTLDNLVFVEGEYPGTPAHFLDFKAIDLLDDLTKKEKSFTYFLKWGAHFHFENSYPDSLQHYKPIQEKTNWKRENKERLLNSYQNSLRWNTDHFLEVIFEKFKDKKILFIYTSDHGQNLMDDTSTKLTHCAKGKAPAVMANVPLILFSPNDSLNTGLRSMFSTSNLNKGSHFNIFPSVLEVMGYAKSYIQENYGTSVFDSITVDKTLFTSGDIFGRSPIYFNEFEK